MRANRRLWAWQFGGGPGGEQVLCKCLCCCECLRKCFDSLLWSWQNDFWASHIRYLGLDFLIPKLELLLPGHRANVTWRKLLFVRVLD